MGFGTALALFFATGASASVMPTYTETRVANGYTGGGTAKNWRLDDDFWSLSLPFQFPFYDQKYTQAFVGSNGHITFDSGATFPGLATTKGIFPYSADLFARHGGDFAQDIRVSSSGSEVRVTWNTETYSGQSTTGYSYSQPATTSLTTGTAQGWKGDDEYWALALPFTFPFYGQQFGTAYVNSNGYLTFGSGLISNAPSLSLHKGIFAFAKDLRTDCSDTDIYTSSSASVMRIRWQARAHALGACTAGARVDFEIDMYPDGSIELLYGQINDAMLDQVIGISKGDSVNFVKSAKDHLLIPPGASKDRYVPSGGWPVNFEVTLKPSGEIRLRYGQMTDPGSGMVGISRGDGTNYQTVSGYDGVPIPSNAQTVILTRQPSTTPPAISGYQVTPPIFSPDGDGNAETATFSASWNRFGTWSLAVKNDAGATVRTYTGSGLSFSQAWNGKNAAGANVPDGTYTGALTVTDIDNLSTTQNVNVIRDTSGPTITSFAASPNPFSNNNDGVKEDTWISMAISDPSPPIDYSLVIKNSANLTVYSSSGSGNPTVDVSDFWDGRDTLGNPVLPGTYTATLTATDSQDLSTTSSISILNDHSPPTVSNFTASPSPFSPNNDTIKDRATFTWNASDPSTPIGWNLTIKNSVGTTVRTYTGSGTPYSQEWDGKNSSGTVVANGVYTATLTATDSQNLSASPVTTTVRVDNGWPVTVNLGFSTTAFSPNGDNDWDTTTYRGTMTDDSPPIAWQLVITNASGATVRTYSGSGGALENTYSLEQTWDGKNASGVVVPDGTYTGTVTATDDVGNSTTFSDDVDVDTVKPTIADFVASPNPFSPNEDNHNEITTLSATLSDPSTPIRWAIDIAKPDGTIVRSYAETDGPVSRTWDGKDALGTVVDDGDYLATITATDAAHNKRSQTTSVTVRKTGTPTDENAPTGPITTPVNGATVSGTSLAITANPSDGSGSGVAQVDFYYTSLGKKALISSDTDGSNGWGTTLDTTKLPEGKLTINAEYTDNVGNFACCAPRSSVAVIVNNAVPAPEDWVATVDADGIELAGTGAEVALNTGQLLLSAIDESLPGRGFTATFGRSYNSASSTRGVLGQGWRTSVDDVLVPSFDGSVTYLDSVGREQRFAPTTASGLSATYFNNPILAGAPALSRTDTAINFNWGTGSPGTGVEADNFSVRWKGLLNVPTAGTWTFYSTTNDGARVFVDGNPVIDNWFNPTASEVSGTAVLGAGLHEFAVEYFEGTGSASTVMSWAGPGVAKQVIPAANLLRQTGYSSPAGLYLTLIRNSNGSFSLKNNYGFTGEFFASGRQQRVADANGNSIEIGYDTQDRPKYVCVSVASCTSSNAKYTLTYDAADRIASLSDGYPRTWSYTYDAAGRLQQVTDPLNHTVTYGYDGAGRLIEITDPEGNEARATYDASGRVSSVKDARAVASGGPAMTIAYTPTTATAISAKANAMNPVGAGTLYTLGTSGQMLGRTDPLGNLTSWTWDANFNVLTETDARGKITTYTYDTKGNLTSEKDPLNHTIAYTFDANNNLTAITDPLGKSTTLTYDSKRNLLSATNPLGKKTTFTYDSYGQQLTEVDPRGNEAGANPANFRTTFAYDANGNLVSITNPLGNTTSFTYDFAGNQLSLTDPLGHSTTATYNALGDVLSITDAEGNKITYAYDAASRLIERVSPMGNVVGADPTQYKTTTTYYADGLTQSVADALGNTSNFAYDPNGNLSTVTDPRGKITSYSYNLNDWLTSVTDPDGAVTTYAFDTVGRTTAITDPKGTTTYDYDDADETLAIKGPRVDATGAPLKTSFTYDAAGNLLTATEPAGNILGAPAGSYKTTQIYDDAGQLRTMTDAAGNTSTYVYDGAGNQTSVTDGTGAVSQYSYDAIGNLTQLKVPGSVPSTKTGSVDFTGTSTWTTTFTTTTSGTISAALAWPTATADLDLQLLNAGGSVVAEGNHTERPESLIYSNAAAGTYTLKVIARALSSSFTLDYSIPKLQTTSIAYDVAGRQSSLTNALGTTAFTYDNANRLIRETLPDGSTHTHEYFADSEVKKIVDPTGTQQFTYDRAGRLTTASDQASVVTSYQYDAASNPVSVTRSNGNFTSAWDEQNRLQTRTRNGTASFVYGDKLYLTEITAAAGDVDRRTLDEEGRVLSLELKTSATAQPRVTYAYSYDPQGNRAQATKTTTGVPVTVASYDYDGLDRLSSETFLAGVVQKTIDYEYDAQYNRTRMTAAGATTTYAHNPAGQLLRRVDPLGKATSYFYDGTGNLTRSVSADGTTTYTWEAEGDLASVSGPSGTVSFAYDAEGRRRTKTVGSTITTYSYEGDAIIEESTSGIGATRYTYDDNGAPLAITLPSGTTYTYHYDAGGSVIELTDSAHQVAATYTYDAWGNIVDATGSQSLRDANPYTYRGRFGVRFDRETGLYLMGARYYDPVLGRFISRDPIEADPSRSSYVYALSNPVAGLDPTGLFPVPETDINLERAGCAARGDLECRTWGNGDEPVHQQQEPKPKPKPKRESKPKPKEEPKPKPQSQPKPKKELITLPWDDGVWRCICGNGYRQEAKGHKEAYGDYYATDWSFATGTRVLATMSGKVGQPSPNGYGTDVVVQHKIGSKTVFSRYAHLQKALVRPGNYVKQGQRIGKSDCTGRCYGAHLHFAMFRNGSPKSYKPEPIDGYTGLREDRCYKAGGGKVRNRC